MSLGSSTPPKKKEKKETKYSPSYKFDRFSIQHPAKRYSRFYPKKINIITIRQ